MLSEDTWKEVYAPRGYLAVEGDWIKRAAYGRTLEEVAKHGAGVFYNGSIADAMINKLESVNGVMTHKDVRPLPPSSFSEGHKADRDSCKGSKQLPTHPSIRSGTTKQSIRHLHPHRAQCYLPSSTSLRDTIFHPLQRPKADVMAR
jgi:hypothetical protein